jgi:deoxycytidylate deaminase
MPNICVCMYDYMYDYDVKNISPYNPTKNEINYAHLAFHLALQHGKVKHGKHCAIIYDENDNIISAVVNKYNILSCGKQISTHAEVGAILKAKKLNPNLDLSKCKIMVIRGNFIGAFTMSKPCINCYNNIISNGIKTIIYSNNSSQNKPEFYRIIVE